MKRHRDVSVYAANSGSWCVSLKGVPVREGLSRAEAENLATRTPSELVKGTSAARDWFDRGAAAERITGGMVRAEDVCEPIRSGPYVLDLFDVYSRMWDFASDLDDRTRVFQPRPGGREALKWIIEDLSGTPTDPVKTMKDNNAIRRAVHARLEERGWAERVNQTSFHLLRDPESTPVHADEALVDPGVELLSAAHEDDGEIVVDVVTDNVVDAEGDVRLGGLEWSGWHPLHDAAHVATTSPGVYLARADEDIVYVGMAGERRGKGVRGRLQIYARGRGAVSGLGEAALDRALSDPEWLSEQLERLRMNGPSRTKLWATEALRHADLSLCWTPAPSAETAREWETRVLLELEDVALWNRARPSK